MINPKIEAAFNAHLNEEFYSSYLYLSMSAYFESNNLNGFANWMKLQSAEEYMHAQKFYTYILQKGGKVSLQAIRQPETDWSSTVDVFEKTYEHEQSITKRIDELANLAMEVRDHASMNFLQWFVNEQVEEEATVVKIIEDLKMVADNRSGLFLLDRELGTRAAAPSAE